jgi:acetyl esterase/lipase
VAALEVVALEVVVLDSPWLDTTFPLTSDRIIIAVSLPRMQFAIRPLVIGLWSLVEAFLNNSHANILQGEGVGMEADVDFPTSCHNNN